MRKPIILFLALIFISRIIFAADEILVKPALSNVKVFLRGAQLNYAAKAKIEKGMNDFVFSGLSNNIDRNSINVIR